MKNKKILIGIALIIILVVIIVAIVVNVRGKQSKDITEEVIEVIEELTSTDDWFFSTYEITEIYEVRKIDLDLWEEGDETKEELGDDVGIYMIDLETEEDGELIIIVVDNEVTETSKTWEEEVWDTWESDIFTNDTVNLDELNEAL